MMRKTEESLNAALTTVRNTQVSFRNSSVAGTQAAQPQQSEQEAGETEDKTEAEEKPVSRKRSGDIPLDFGISERRRG